MARLQRGSKAIAQPIEIGPIRSLARGDLAVLAEPRPPNSLQTLRDNHHRIARAIASGLSNSQVVETCGISYSRVISLRSDPAMVELIAHYRAVLTAEWVKEADPVIDFLRTNAIKAQAMLSDKLDDAAERNEFLPTRDLLGIAELGLDRTGYGKERKNVNVNMDFAAALEAARKRSAVAESARTIDGSSTHQSASAPLSPPAQKEPMSSPVPSVARRF